VQLELGILVPAYTKQLMIYRRAWFTPERLDKAKRLRKDFPESERLRALAAEQEAAEQAAELAEAGGEKEDAEMAE
jgi:hypothetical protein